MNSFKIIILLLLCAVLGITLPAFAEENNKRAELENQLEELKNATEKFKELGVGVTPFEAEIACIDKLIAEEKLDAAGQKIERLKAGLSDQQKRFYASKLFVYNQQRKKLLAERKKRGQVPQPSISDGAGLSRAAHGVLKEDKGRKYTPLIYPIAR